MKIDANGITLNYEVIGRGAPLLLLHGNGENHHIFDALAGRLADHFTVYSLDSRNHGLSQVTDDYSYETMAKDVGAFIRTLDLGKVYIVGFSDGAIIALMLSLNDASLVSGMALLGLNLKPSDFTEESYRYIEEAYDETKDPLFKLMLEQPDIELDEVRKVSVPVLLVSAENDLFKPESFKAMADAFPNVMAKIMMGHDHDSYVTNESILYPDLIRFFS